MSKKSFSQIFAEAEQRDSYWVEGAILDFTKELHNLMKKKGITNAELADKIGTSRSYITKVFRGNANFTVESMIKLTRAVGGNLHVHVTDQEAEVRWVDVFDGGKNKCTISEECSVDEHESPGTTFNWEELLPALKKVELKKHVAV